MRALRDPNARDLHGVAAMMMLATQRTDADARADIFRQLSGVTDPGLEQPLLHALANDATITARDEAAETLAGFSR